MCWFPVGACYHLSSLGSGEGMYGPCTYRNGSSSRGEQLGFGPEELTPQLSSSAEWTKLLSWSTGKCNVCFSLSSSQLRFSLCCESLVYLLERPSVLGHHITPGTSGGTAVYVLLSYQQWVAPGVCLAE